MATTLEKFYQAVERFEGNETHVDVFANDPEEQGSYTTNTSPTKQVETLPNLMRRLKHHYLTILFKGPWLPDTQYGLNNVVQGPEGDFWLVVEPYISGTTIQEDIDSRKLIPYGSTTITGQRNSRWSWLAVTSVDVGEILELPRPYTPGNNNLLLFYLGVVCVPKNDLLELTDAYQYEEINNEPGLASNQIRVWFPIAAGDVLDMFVPASDTAEAAAAAIDAAERAEEAVSDVREQLPALASEVSQLIVDAEALLVTLQELEASIPTLPELLIYRNLHLMESDLAAGEDLTVPPYIVNGQRLRVWFNGVRCYPGSDETLHQYMEVGAIGSESTTIRFNFELAVGDIVLSEIG